MKIFGIVNNEFVKHEVNDKIDAVELVRELILNSDVKTLVIEN